MIRKERERTVRYNRFTGKERNLKHQYDTNIEIQQAAYVRICTNSCRVIGYVVKFGKIEKLDWQ